ncbi:MAG: hypothetical protein IKX67_07105 [Bacteroidales bacterium]|nr:hypothetical protein [Bacteroidales bacterium]
MYYGERPPLVTVSKSGTEYHTTVNYSIEESGEGFEVKSVTVVTDAPLSEEHYSMLVTALIRIRYTAEDEFAVARQCLSEAAEYVAYNKFVEKCKEVACSVLEMAYSPDYNPTMAEVMTQLLTLLKGNVSELDDAAALEVPALFDPWSPGIDVGAGERRYFGGKLYKCLQPHKTQSDWAPDATPALWTEVSADEWPEWKQPTGAHDAYNTGDRVSYGGKHYTSTIDGNIWAPDAYPAGWSEE